ncbi:MAG TPA: recombinase family protein [Flavobacterium sp.]|uniref:recombinase family protein n=1 Tax=Flavobacterium sp. TaxID=239 RepID=UPI002B4AF400|nr:recombinase family protein [Flavobacterium sp.]HLO73890.1 recombinase family protein [Flavobacterium sp.]
MKKYVSYYRVSTQQQGNSGLGLQSQKSMVNTFLKKEDVLINEYEEIESGKNNNRPELLKAIEQCKKDKAILLIAKLDRLSRNASFIFTLRDSNIEFVCTDIPEANSVTIGIMAVLAQDERERISKRTKDALAELKRKGVKLGSPQNLTNEARLKGIEATIQKALNNENNRKATALIISLKKDNLSYRRIAFELNKNGFKTSMGMEFSGSQVLFLLRRHLANNLNFNISQ